VTKAAAKENKMRPFQLTQRVASIALLALAPVACYTPHRTAMPPVADHSAGPRPSTRPAAPLSGLDGYKMTVAEQILGANPSIIFSGQLPPMLPAIVVVNISIDRNGKLARLVVQRSRDSEASQVALDAVKRSAPFPKPLLLNVRGDDTLDFSETFLFNHQYQFQLRTLAGPQ
jgi:periplasmic protein TonB